MAKGIKGLVVEIGGDTSGLQKALQEARTASTKLTTELNQVNKALKLDTKNPELLAQKQKVLNESIEKTTVYLEQLRQHEQDVLNSGIELTGKNAEHFRALQREIAEVQAKLNKLNFENSNFAKIGKYLDEVGNKIQNVGNKISSLGDKLNKISLPAIAGLTATAKAAIDFESAFAGVEKTVDGTEQQMAKLKKGIKDMAEVVPSTTTEIAGVAEAAGQLGIKTDDVLSFTKTMIDLGNSTNLSATEAASALAKFANITGTSSKDFNRLGSVIVDLGNNFATTEADIVAMATGLAATGELAGLTEPQIFALSTAMSSVGIEAAAGSTAMSKLLKKIQVGVETGSKDLEKFAKVAGVSAKDFKKAYEEDAVKALSLFLTGLKDTNRNGKSAVAILDDMGIKEVRLSNTILSLSNASDMLSDSIDTANKAWKEDSALVKEANKRYATTESQLKKTWNQVKNLAVNIGNKLLPIIQKILEKVQGWLKQLENLNEEQLDTIVKIGLIVSAAGPLLKILGTLTTTIGGVAKGIGTFSTAIGVLKTGAQSANVAANVLASGISALASPVGLLVAGITAVVAIAAIMINTTSQLSEEQKRHKAVIEDVNKSLDDYKTSMDNADKARQEYLNTNMSEIQYYDDLMTELKGITDENGKVKDGYEQRAKFITETLSNALGVEIKLTDGVVQNYKTLEEKIKDVIEAKRAETLLNANEEKYNTARDKKVSLEDAYSKALAESNKNEQDRNNTLQKMSEWLGISVEKLQEFVGEDGKVNTHNLSIYGAEIDNLKVRTAGAYTEFLGLNNELQKSNAAYKESTTALEGARTAYQENQLTIDNYETALINLKDKNYEAVMGIYEDTHTFVGKTDKETYDNYQKQIDMQEDYIKQLKENKAGYDQDYIDKEVKKKEDVINNLKEQQAQYKTFTKEGLDGTKTIWNNGLDEILSEITGSNIEFKEDAQGNIEMYIDGVKSGESKSKEEMAKLIDGTIAEIEKQDPEAEKAGENLIKGVNDGCKKQDIQNDVFATLKKFGLNLLSTLKSSVKEQSPSKATRQMGQYLLEGFGLGIEDEEDKVLKQAKEFGEDLLDTLESDLDLDANLNINKFKLPQLTQGQLATATAQGNNSIVLNFNPQTMTEAELDKAFNYVNRRLGTAY